MESWLPACFQTRASESNDKPPLLPVKHTVGGDRGGPKEEDEDRMESEESKTDYPFPRVTQSRNDSIVDVASSLYAHSTTHRQKVVRYTIIQTLGKGHYGTVFLAQETGAQVAVKILKKSVHNINKYAYVEEAILRTARSCPFIIHLFNSFQTEKAYYLVMDCATGGNLKEILDEHGTISIDATRFLCAEIILGLQFLHTHGIIHRDLKIQNILLSGNNHVRLIDFGLSKMGIYGGDTTNSGCGTPFYMAPEILRRLPYSHEVDWWALGIVLYKIVTGTFPFMGKTNAEVFAAVTRDTVFYDSRFPHKFVSLCKGFLTKQPPRRLGTGASGFDDIKSHIFFEPIDWDRLMKQEITMPSISPLPELPVMVFTGKRARVHTTRRLSQSVPDHPGEEGGKPEVEVKKREGSLAPAPVGRSLSPPGLKAQASEVPSSGSMLRTKSGERRGGKESAEEENKRNLELQRKFPLVESNYKLTDGKLKELVFTADSKEMAYSNVD